MNANVGKIISVLMMMI